MKNQKKDLNSRLRQLRFFNQISPGPLVTRFDVVNPLTSAFMEHLLMSITFNQPIADREEFQIDQYKQQLEEALKREDYQEAARLDKLLKQANEAK